MSAKVKKRPSMAALFKQVHPSMGAKVKKRPSMAALFK
jgi:hypothetical protein